MRFKKSKPLRVLRVFEGFWKKVFGGFLKWCENGFFGILHRTQHNWPIINLEEHQMSKAPKEFSYNYQRKTYKNRGCSLYWSARKELQYLFFQYPSKSLKTIKTLKEFNFFSCNKYNKKFNTQIKTWALYQNSNPNSSIAQSYNRNTFPSQ